MEMRRKKEKRECVHKETYNKFMQQQKATKTNEVRVAGRCLQSSKRVALHNTYS